jgi:hypothetical protein
MSTENSKTNQSKGLPGTAQRCAVILRERPSGGSVAGLCQHPSCDRSMNPPALLRPLCDPVSSSVVNRSQTARMRACYNELPILPSLVQDPGYNHRKLTFYILQYSCCYQQISFSNKFLLICI